MFHILKEGKVPPTKELFGMCRNCSTEFKCNEEDCSSTSLCCGWNYPSGRQSKCPKCLKVVYVHYDSIRKCEESCVL